MRPTAYNFKRSNKPASIRAAQREARQVYQQLCDMSAPRNNPTITKLIFFKEVVQASPDELYGIAPHYAHVVDTAVRAYCAAGASLLKQSNLFALNLVVPIQELSFYKDLGEEHIRQLRVLPSETTEVMFMAREL